MSHKCVLNLLCFALIIITSFILREILQNLKEFDTCVAPIQITLLLTTCYMLCLFSLMLFLDPPCCESSARTEKCATLFYFWIIGPFSCYILAQGILWNIQNTKFPNDMCPILPTWGILGALFLSVIQYLWSLLKRIVLRFKLYRNRRRIRQMINDFSSNNYQNLERMVSGMSDSDINIDNRIGLSANEIGMIKKRFFTQSFMDHLRGEQDSCAVCVEHFKERDEVLNLPKCHHLFHPKCVEAWFLQSPLCPLCRSNIRLNLACEMT